MCKVLDAGKTQSNVRDEVPFILLEITDIVTTIFHKIYKCKS